LGAQCNILNWMLAIFTYVGVEVAIGSNFGWIIVPRVWKLQSSDIAIVYFYVLGWFNDCQQEYAAFNLQGSKKQLH
jgi:fucose permease